MNRVQVAAIMALHGDWLDRTISAGVSKFKKEAFLSSLEITREVWSQPDAPDWFAALRPWDRESLIEHRLAILIETGLFKSYLNNHRTTYQAVDILDALAAI
jgi:hypothetical protein